MGSILTPLEQAEIVATGRVVEVENAPGIQTARFAIEKQLAGEAVGQKTIWVVSPRAQSGNPLPNDLSLEKGERVLLLLLPVSGEGAPGLPESAEVYTLVPRAGQAKIEAGEGGASESVALVAGYLAVLETGSSMCSSAFAIISGWFSIPFTLAATRSCSMIEPMLRAWVKP